MRHSSRLLDGVASRLLLLVASVCATLLFIEVAIRIAIPQEEVFLVADPVLGFAHPPGRTGYWIRERTSPHVVSINSRGLRDREFDYRKPPGVRRILMLGDSLTEGFQVDLEQTSSKYLETLLRRNGYDHVEVLNLGVSGYGTAQELLYYQTEGIKYDPDIVILNLFLGNDLSENLYQDGYFQRPAYSLKDGQLVFHPTSTRSGMSVFLRDRILARSALLKLIKPLLLRDNPMLHDWLGRWGFVTGPQGVAQPQQDHALLVAVTSKILQEFAEETRKRGHKFLVYMIPSSYDLYPSYLENLDGYDRLVRQRWLPDIDTAIQVHAFYHERLAAFMREASIPFVDGYVGLRQRAAQGDLLYTSMLLPELRDGHLSPLGHYRSAELIFDSLLAHQYP